MTIIEAWDKLKESHRNITIVDQVAKSAYQDSALFFILTWSLLVDYQGVIDIRDIQVSRIIKDKIKSI
jgi:hypothetical protein